jgi:Rod binding domain-containing protein
MPDKLAQACAQFEALMLKQMLTDAGIGRTVSLSHSADSDADDGGDVSGSAGADMMQSMFVDALAQAVAGSDRAGLAHVLETSLRGIAK